jgi:methylase of polypeptide subunit release factors
MIEPRLFPERESVALVRSCLDRHGFDLAHEMVRTDYLTSPVPDREVLLPRLERLDPALQLLFLIFTLGESIAPESIASTLGDDFLEATVATGLLVFDTTQERVSTRGLQIVSRLGQYFIVSTSRVAPAFDSQAADIYLGPESYTLANYLQRRAPRLPSAGRGLDLCSGSAIAGQSLAALRRGIVWTGVDVSAQAVEAARYNALLNELSDRYTPVSGDLYAPVGDQRFQLIVANPPFIPVPSTVDFPGYGDGGEDGLSVLAPLIQGLFAHLAPSGHAIVYAEGIGNERGPFVLDLLERVASNGLTIGLTILSTMTVDQTLFSIGRMLAAQQPSSLDQLKEWHRLFGELGVTRYDKFLIEAVVGEPSIIVRELEAAKIHRPASI